MADCSHKQHNIVYDVLLLIIAILAFFALRELFAWFFKNNHAYSQSIENGQKLDRIMKHLKLWFCDVNAKTWIISTPQNKKKMPRRKGTSDRQDELRICLRMIRDPSVLPSALLSNGETAKSAAWNYVTWDHTHNHTHNNKKTTDSWCHHLSN